jgi:phosphatidylserine/phosphatidylglycerophosphate/cardiolipin synthase-like enzyme
MNGSLDYGGIQERLNSLLDRLPSSLSDKVLRAVPIAAPVLSIRWRVLEIHTEPVGLMERNILKAVSLLGPATVEELDDLLQLDVYRIKRALEHLSHAGAPIRQAAGKYELTICESEVGEMLDLRREVEHEREFVLSGLCERLLPVKFWEDHKKLQLFLIDRESDELVDSTGTEAMVRHVLKPATSDGRRALEESLCDDDMSAKEMLGVPAGMSALVGDLPVNREVAWVLAFLITTLDGKVRLFSAADSVYEFDLPGDPTSDWLPTACRTLSETDISVSWSPEKLAEQKLFEPWPEKFKVVPETATVHVPLDAPARELRLPDNMVGEDSGVGNKTPWYCRSLIFGRCWSGPPQFILLRIMPGNAKTEKRVCVLSAAMALRRYVLFEQGLKPGDLEDWWESYTHEFLARMGKKGGRPGLKLAHVLEEARQIQDTEFHEKLSSIQSHHDQTGSVTGRTDQMVSPRVVANIPGHETSLGNQILLLVRNARKRLFLISPMVADERLLNAIVCARSRGVEVRLLTELLERKQGKLKFPTKGFEFEPESSLRDHSENLRKLVNHGVFCRSMTFYAHAKLVIADNENGIVSSANLSSNSLGWGKQPACEAGVLLGKSAPLSCLGNLFEGLWQAAPYQMHARLGDTELVEEKGSELPPEMLTQSCEGDRIVLSMPPDEFRLLDEIVTACDRATESILILCMSCYGLAEMPHLLEALEKALAKGIPVTLVVRKDFWGDAIWPDKGLDGLHRAGMQIKCIPNLHVKGLVIDDREVGIFSANITPYSLNNTGLSAHVEIGIFGDVSEPSWQEWRDLLVGLAEEAENAFALREE